VSSQQLKHTYDG